MNRGESLYEEDPYLFGLTLSPFVGMIIHIWRCIMRTNIALDDRLVEEAFKVSHAKTKKALINEALKEYVDNRKRLDLLDLSGKLLFRKNYDYKSMREGK
jgi:Arc/MetJ family transcription regulator